MGKIIAIANQKGGVAKTTTTYNLAALCAMKGKKTLMVDLDSQASLTIAVGLEPIEDCEYANIAIAMKTFIDKKEQTKDIKECIYGIDQIANLYICPSIIDLAELETLLTNVTLREKTLDNVLKSVRNEYDYIFIDCSPSLGNLTVNALTCADYVVTPCETDYLAFRGLKALEDTIEDIKELINNNLNFIGVIATKYENTKDANIVLQTLEEQHNILGVIKKSVSIKDGIYDGLPIVALDTQKNIAIEIKQEYEKILEKILNIG